MMRAAVHVLVLQRFRDSVANNMEAERFEARTMKIHSNRMGSSISSRRFVQNLERDKPKEVYHLITIRRGVNSSRERRTGRE
jgi:hypothetical protein